MPPGLNFGLGIARLIAAQQRYTRTTTPVYLRLRGFNAAKTASTQWQQMGFRTTPADGPLAVQDVLIDPPPSMSTVSMRTIGASGGKLFVGAKVFTVAAEFISAMQRKLSLTDARKVLSDQSVGLVNEGILYAIVDIQNEVVAGEVTVWVLLCNGAVVR